MFPSNVLGVTCAGSHRQPPYPILALCRYQVHAPVLQPMALPLASAIQIDRGGESSRPTALRPARCDRYRPALT